MSRTRHLRFLPLFVIFCLARRRPHRTNNQKCLLLTHKSGNKIAKAECVKCVRVWGVWNHNQRDEVKNPSYMNAMPNGSTASIKCIAFYFFCIFTRSPHLPVLLALPRALKHTHNSICQFVFLVRFRIRTHYTHTHAIWSQSYVDVCVFSRSLQSQCRPSEHTKIEMTESISIIR